MKTNKEMIWLPGGGDWYFSDPHQRAAAAAGPKHLQHHAMHSTPCVTCDAECVCIKEI